MGRRLDLMGRKVTDVLAKMELGERDEAQLVHDAEPKEQLVFTGPADWTPDQAEQYIDWRIHLVDANVAKLRQQLDDQIAMRRRWLAVTGGRSKVSPSGNGTGSPIGAGESGTAAATGSADRVVSRRTGRGSSGRVDLPHRSCPSEPLAATKLHPEGRTIGHRGG